jgi:hypothetical protein
MEVIEKFTMVMRPKLRSVGYFANGFSVGVNGRCDACAAGEPFMAYEIG